MPKRRAGCHFPATSSGRGGPGTRLRTWLPGLPGLAILSRHSWGSGVAPGPLLAGWSSLPCTSQKKRADDPQLLKGQAVAGTQAGLPLPHRSTDPGGARLAPPPPEGPPPSPFSPWSPFWPFMLPMCTSSMEPGLPGRPTSPLSPLKPGSPRGPEEPGKPWSPAEER